MNKLFVLAVISTFITGCSSFNRNVEYYRIPDNAVISFITEKNNIEKCLPDDVRMKSLDATERRVLNRIKLDALIHLIGIKAQNIWYPKTVSDVYSNRFLRKRLVALDHKKTDVTEKECLVMKTRFQKQLTAYLAQQQSEKELAKISAQQKANVQQIQIIQGIEIKNPSSGSQNSTKSSEKVSIQDTPESELPLAEQIQQKNQNMIECIRTRKCH